MPVNNSITKDEMKLLAYLHEHAEGYTEEFELDPSEVVKAMGVEAPEFTKNASYLAAHGLVGMRTIDTSTLADRSFDFGGIYLTGHGENFMRELENQPGIAKRITAGTAGAIYDTARQVIVRVLADFLSGGLR